MSLLLRYLETHALLSPADLEVAQRRQQNAGGSLDTALLELGLLTPAQLDECLREACGLPTAPVRLLERGPTRPWELVPKDLVDIGFVIPLAQEQGQVLVAVHPDLPDAKLGLLYRQIRGLQPMVSPECCLAKVAAERSGAILSSRYALVVLDYLQALRRRGAPAPEDHEHAMQDAPVPSDRPQRTEPMRPAARATENGSAGISRTSDVPLERAARAPTVRIAAAREPGDAPREPSSRPPTARTPVARAQVELTRHAPRPTAVSGDIQDAPARRQTGSHPVPPEGRRQTGTHPVPADSPPEGRRQTGAHPVPADSPRGEGRRQTGTHPVPADSQARAEGHAAPEGRAEQSAPEDSREGRAEQSVPEDSREGRAAQSVPEDSREGRADQPVPEDSREGRADQPVPEDSREGRDAQPVPGDSREDAAAGGHARADDRARPGPADGRADEPRARSAEARDARSAPESSSRAADATGAEPGAAPASSDRSVDAEPGAPTRAEERPRRGSGPAPAATPPTVVLPLAQRLAVARTTLANARERDRITEALVRASAIIAPRVGLFGVKREGLRVLPAPGSALRLTEGLIIPLPEGSLLDRAVTGQLELTALSEPSLSFAVGQPMGIPCVFEHVNAGGRTVLMLYVDRAGVAFDPAERAAIRELCDLARQSLEALLRLLGWNIAAPSASAAHRAAVAAAQPTARPAEPAQTAPEGMLGRTGTISSMVPPVTTQPGALEARDAASAPRATPRETDAPTRSDARPAAREPRERDAAPRSDALSAATRERAGAAPHADSLSVAVREADAPSRVLVASVASREAVDVARAGTDLSAQKGAGSTSEPARAGDRTEASAPGAPPASAQDAAPTRAEAPASGLSSKPAERPSAESAREETPTLAGETSLDLSAGTAAAGERAAEPASAADTEAPDDLSEKPDASEREADAARTRYDEAAVTLSDGQLPEDLRDAGGSAGDTLRGPVPITPTELDGEARVVVDEGVPDDLAATTGVFPAARTQRPLEVTADLPRAAERAAAESMSARPASRSLRSARAVITLKNPIRRDEGGPNAGSDEGSSSSEVPADELSETRPHSGEATSDEPSPSAAAPTEARGRDETSTEARTEAEATASDAAADEAAPTRPPSRVAEAAAPESRRDDASTRPPSRVAEAAAPEARRDDAASTRPPSRVAEAAAPEARRDDASTRPPSRVAEAAAPEARRDAASTRPPSRVAEAAAPEARRDAASTRPPSRVAEAAAPEARRDAASTRPPSRVAEAAAPEARRDDAASTRPPSRVAEAAAPEASREAPSTRPPSRAVASADTDARREASSARPPSQAVEAASTRPPSRAVDAVLTEPHPHADEPVFQLLDDDDGAPIPAIRRNVAGESPLVARFADFVDGEEALPAATAESADEAAEAAAPAETASDAPAEAAAPAETASDAPAEAASDEPEAASKDLSASTGPEGQAQDEPPDLWPDAPRTAGDVPDLWADAPAAAPPAEAAPRAPAGPAPALHMPNLVAPPGLRGAGRRRAPSRPPEPVLVIPKTLRRSAELAATPHPMGRRSEREEPTAGDAEAPAPAPTLSIPVSLINPRSGRRRAKHEPRPEGPPPTLHMPRLVKAETSATPAPEASAEETGTSEQVATDSPADAAPPEVRADAAPDAASDASAPVEPADAASEPTDDADADAASEPDTDDDDAAASEPADDVPAAEESGASEPTPQDDPLDAVIDAFLQSPGDREQLARLRALDGAGFARLAARFPGPIDLGDATNFPPPSAHGPLLRACVEIGPAITPAVLELFRSQRPQIRFYAAFLFQELRDPRCLQPLGELAFDPDPDVRLIATRVLESYSRAPEFAAVAARVRAGLESEDPERQLQAAEATGTLRDTGGVPRLIDLLTVRDKQIREAALESLCSITAKHHGYRSARWRSWYAEHGHESRIEWVMDGLRHRDSAVRRWAADELVRVTGQRIAFPVDGDRRSRELALRAWQDWWAEHRAEFTGKS